MLDYFDFDKLLEAGDDIDVAPKKGAADYSVTDSEEDQEQDPKLKTVDGPVEDEGEPDTGDDTTDAGEEPDYDITDSEDSEEGDSGNDDEEDSTEDVQDGEDSENIEEKSLKPENLFENYELLYKGISNLAHQINNISVRSDGEVDIIERVMNSLNKLQKLVYDYMTKVYKSKSYSENLTNLHEFQAVLDLNVKLIEQISLNRKSDDKTSK